MHGSDKNTCEILVALSAGKIIFGRIRLGWG